MIRRVISKRTSFDNLKQKEIKVIERWINNYPRKIFGFKSSNEIYNEKNSDKTV